MTRTECRRSISTPTSNESDAGMSNKKNASECNEIPYLKTCPAVGDSRDCQYRNTSQEAHDTGHHSHPSLHGLVNSQCSNVLEFFRDIPQDVRKCLAEFLSSGVTGDLEINEENFHYFFHVANHLNLRRLQQCCMEVYVKGETTRIKETIGMCQCANYLEQLVATAYRRQTSDLWHEKDSDSDRKFQVLFLTKDKDRRKQPIVVTDFAGDFKIYKQDIVNAKRVGDGFAACAFEKKGCPYIFVSGGEEKKKSQIWQYDVILDKWSKAGKMLHSRSRHLMVTVKDKIYLIGGQYTACIEEFDPINGKCVEIGSLPVAAWSSAHAVYNDTIYIFGGKKHAGRISTVQSFNCKTNRLARLEDLPCACSGCQAVVLGGMIYIATIEGHMIKFNPADGNSQLCASQPCARRHFVMFVRNERIYMTGGVRPSGERRGDMNHLYKYSPEADIWSDVATLSTSLPVYTCCTVRFSGTCGIVPFVKLRSIR
ncbi:hypothetical protein ACJMK2_028480 [Sinanodonta woodiana]|uniref:Uncharacterized protein n=1 Tax=Sinanodonta woodiana TaxID=1069815 RepID=A0ABD3X789_SINWO